MNLNHRDTVFQANTLAQKDDMEIPLFSIFHQLDKTDNKQHVIHELRDYCLQTTALENQRVGMEFLYSQGFLEELDKLIDINLMSSNTTNQKWARVYQIMNQRRKAKKDPEDYTVATKYLDAIERLDLQELELQCLGDLLHIFCFFDLKQYDKIGLHSDQVLLAIHQLRDPMFKELVSIRLDEALMIFHWKRNEMILSRKFGYRILNTTHNDRKLIDVHNIMALGYLFDSYDQAMYHANEGLRLALEINLDSAMDGLLNYTIPFISAYHGKTEGVSTNIKSEQAHLALAKGDVDTCIAILSEFDKLTPFQEYYLGKATQDATLLQSSYRRFRQERNDYFFARLPLEAFSTISNLQRG